MASPATALRARGRALAERIDHGTPGHRDRTVDALRALAILGVIGGHWLVTSLVATGRPPGGTGATPAGGGATGALRTLVNESPLTRMPYLAPVSWLLETLAVFFFVGGYAAAASRRGPYRVWLRARMTRLARPVLVLAAAWVPLSLALWTAGIDLRPVLTLVVSPLWFVAVYAGLTALTPAPARAARHAVPAAIAMAGVVAAVDLTRFGLGGPQWIGWVNVPAAWLVPYLLGMRRATGGLGGRRTAWALLAGGTAATVALVAGCGYPASMVGVPGSAVSNLSPPTLASVAFGLAQTGLALVAWPWLARWTRRPAVWAAVALANMSAMTLFCWHQTALILVTVTAPAGSGLRDAPGDPGWVLHRLLWLPAFAAALLICWAAFHRVERMRGLGRET